MSDMQSVERKPQWRTYVLSIFFCVTFSIMTEYDGFSRCACWCRATPLGTEDARGLYMRAMMKEETPMILVECSTSTRCSFKNEREFGKARASSCNKVVRYSSAFGRERYPSQTVSSTSTERDIASAFNASIRILPLGIAAGAGCQSWWECDESGMYWAWKMVLEQ